MRLRKFLLLGALVTSVFIAVLFFRAPLETHFFQEEKTENNIKSTSPAALLDGKKQKTTAKIPFPKEAIAEVVRCLGAPASDMTDFSALVYSRTKQKGETQLEWRNLHYEENGQKFRLRLSREAAESGKSYLELKLFSVDAENLPNKIEIPLEHERNPSDNILRNYTEGKHITYTEEAEVISLEDGGEIRVESENGIPVELEWESNELHVACSVKESASCKCFSN
jgi:hypothetical protein